MTHTRFAPAALVMLLAHGLSPAASAAAPAADGSDAVQLPAATSASPAGGAAAARALWQQGDIDAALAALKATLRQNPFDQDALLLLADLQLVRMDGAAAETTLRRALDAQAPRAEVVVPLARALLLQAKPRAVLDEVKPSADLDAATRGRLLAQHAAAQIALGEPAKAAALLDESAAASPQAAEPDLMRAVLALQGGAVDDALAALERALGKAPDTYDACC
jgi:tetratricopeptide (TPR) repeat protein